MMKMAGAVLLCLCLMPVEARALDANRVWDVSQQCFRSKTDPGEGCGLSWHVNSRNYSGDEAKQAAKDGAEDIGARLDAQMAEEAQMVESLKKNENVEKVRAILSKDEMP